MLKACDGERRARFVMLLERGKQRDPSLSDVTAANNAERQIEEVDRNYYPVFRTIRVDVPIVNSPRNLQNGERTRTLSA